MWLLRSLLSSATRRVDVGDGGLTVGALVAGAIAVRIARPGPGSIYPPCPFHWLTGWNCPGCGSMRALRAITDGDLVAAWSLNPAFVVFLFGFASVLTLRSAHVRFPRLPVRAYPLIPVAIVLFWIGRNL